MPEYCVFSTSCRQSLRCDLFSIRSWCWRTRKIECLFLFYSFFAKWIRCNVCLFSLFDDHNHRFTAHTIFDPEKPALTITWCVMWCPVPSMSESGFRLTLYDIWCRAWWRCQQVWCRDWCACRWCFLEPCTALMLLFCMWSHCNIAVIACCWRCMLQCHCSMTRVLIWVCQVCQFLTNAPLGWGICHNYRVKSTISHWQTSEKCSLIQGSSSVELRSCSGLVVSALKACVSSSLSCSDRAKIQGSAGSRDSAEIQIYFADSHLDSH